MKICIGAPPPSGIKSRSLGHGDLSSSPSLLKLPVFLKDPTSRPRAVWPEKVFKVSQASRLPSDSEGPYSPAKDLFPQLGVQRPPHGLLPSRPPAGQLPSLHRAGLELAWHEQPSPPGQVSPFRSSLQDEPVLPVSVDWPSSETASQPPARPSLGSIAKENRSEKTVTASTKSV